MSKLHERRISEATVKPTYPLRIAIIGTGIFATQQHLPILLELKSYFQIVACCNRTKDKAIEFAKKAGIPETKIFTDYNELLQLPEVEIVDICVPIFKNKEIALAAAKAGKHIIMEKPIAGNLEDAREILKISKDYNVVLSIAENYGYKPQVVAMRQLVLGGRIGGCRFSNGSF